MLRQSWTEWAAAFLLVTVAFLLRINQIGEQELWFDESFSYHLATIPNELAHTLRVENSPPLYYLLLRAWVKTAGTSEEALRMPSAICGALFVLVVIWAGRTILTAPTGWWSGVFATVAPIHLYYSQEARTYALLMLLLVLTYTLLWRALERCTTGAWFLASASALLTLYSHYFAVFALLPTALLVWLWPEPDQAARRWRAYGLSTLACAVLFAPWVLWVFTSATHSYDLLPLPPRSQPAPPWVALPRSLEVLGLGSQAGLLPRFIKIFPQLEFPPSLRALGLAALVGLGLLVAVPLGDRMLGVPWLARRKAWLWTLLFFPLCALLVVFSYKPMNTDGRYTTLAFPAFALLVGLALAKLQCLKKVGPLLTPVIALTLLVPLGVKLFLYYEAPVSRDIRLSNRVTAKVLETFVNDGDGVVFTGLRAFPILYYLERAGFRWEAGYCQNQTTGRRFACRTFPPEKEIYLGFRRPSEPIQAVVQGLLAQLKGPDSSLWILFNSGMISSDENFLVSAEDAPLVGELKRLGRTPIPVPIKSAPFLFQVRPSDERSIALPAGT